MTLKEAISESPFHAIGVNFVLHRKYYDDRWNGERDGYMEVEITDYLENESKGDAVVKILIETSFQGHQVGNTEWHDMMWCSQWEVVTTLSKYPS